MDGSFTDRERERIEQLLVDRFHLTLEVAAELLGEAQGHAQDSTGWHGFTTAVKDGFDHQGRIGLVEMMWEIVYADGELHDYEASLMRRVTGLLYVSGAESAEARERALARLGLSSA